MTPFVVRYVAGLKSNAKKLLRLINEVLRSANFSYGEEISTEH